MSQLKSDAVLRVRVSKLSWVIGLVILAILIVTIITHRTEAEQFTALIRHAQPWWLVIAVILQIGTYFCTGTIWYYVTLSAGYRLPFSTLARLSVEKMSINQLVPTAGAAGNVVVMQAMRRLGLPTSLALESLLIDVMAYYAAFAAATVLSILLLISQHSITPVATGLLSAFAVIVTGVSLAIWWLTRHRAWRPPTWLRRRRVIANTLSSISQVSPKRMGTPSLLFKAWLLQLATFILDAGTLWAMTQSIGVTINPWSAFIAVVIAQIAGTVSFLPGGVGGFEAGCTIVLALLGVPLGAALAGTLLLRGLTLWIPLIPGILLAQGELKKTR